MSHYVPPKYVPVPFETCSTGERGPFVSSQRHGASGFQSRWAAGIATSANQLAYAKGKGEFGSPVAIWDDPPPLGFAWIAAGDLNNDGWPDLMAVEGDGIGDYYVPLDTYPWMAEFCARLRACSTDAAAARRKRGTAGASRLRLSVLFPLFTLFDQIDRRRQTHVVV